MTQPADPAWCFRPEALRENVIKDRCIESRPARN
jgi:hypothetical protein